ncbi:ABC transporter substrate-binding protein [Cohnella nanjingensis]|uniref:Extracellular solute-binding protein n=1 Tax=Cohnella nanjingensis TaxID=1387779 RepID=A0A7X0RPZ3_9BACL|nr:extracellular solute-binding protein [Cohnella nanjingensis]MBB6671420.1 extracellular solute-binding protein [Cohnella nanjingensis]
MITKKRASSLLALALFSSVALTACGGNDKGNASSPSASPTDSAAATASASPSSSDASPSAADAEPVKLKLAIWDAKADLEYWTEKAKDYTKLKPNVTVELEKVPDNNGQYLKVRLAANDLPDLFFLKPRDFQVYKSALLPLDELEATKNNKYPTKIDGQVLGLPLVSFSEFVYFHPSIFKELNLEVPKTLPEFMALLAKIKENGKYTPLSLGAKDSWTLYPLAEFGPHMLSGDVNYLANLAKNKEPFGAGSTFDQTAKLIQEIADKKYAGPDALSLSYDQSTQQFETGKSAMIALGQWYYASYMEKVKNDDDLGAFPLPFRSTESEKLMSMTMSDMNVGISKDSKHPDEAKAFLEWMLTGDAYQAYINKVQQFSTVNGIESDLPFFRKWTQQYPFEPFVYDGTDAGYAKVKGAAQYDPALTGQDVFSGKSIEKIEKDLNAKWKKAVESNP